MGFFWIMVLVFIGLAVVVGIGLHIEERKKLARMSPEERANYDEEKQDQLLTFQHGPRNTALVCPHCQEKGSVRTKSVKRKKGISGGKATAALMTGGISTLATGLSRKEQLTQAHCDNCNSSWDF